MNSLNDIPWHGQYIIMSLYHIHYVRSCYSINYHQNFHHWPNQWSSYNDYEGSGHIEGLAVLWEDGTKVEAAAANFLNDRICH